MKRLCLDYQRVERPFPWVGLVLLAVGAAAAGGLASDYGDATRRAQRWEAHVDSLARAVAPRERARPVLTEQAARAQVLEVKSANQVVRELAVPWNALFSAVDACADQDVALLALEPDAQKGTVRIVGEAKDLDALLGYVKKLGARDVFAGVQIQHHQVMADVAEKPLRFAVLARWKGAAS